MSLTSELERPIVEGQHELVTLDDSGDTKLIWDADNDVEVEAAQAMFDKLKKKGYVAYSVKTRGKNKGEKGDVIQKFDPDAERIIMAPQMVGG